jgi:hypothetical protein
MFGVYQQRCSKREHSFLWLNHVGAEKGPGGKTTPGGVKMRDFNQSHCTFSTQQLRSSMTNPQKISSVSSKRTFHSDTFCMCIALYTFCMYRLVGLVGETKQ